MCNSTVDWKEFTEELLQSNLWLGTDVPGVFGRSAVFEDIVTAFEKLVTAMAKEDGAERVFFPPVMSRATLVETGYMESFPELCGSVHSFEGSGNDHSRLLGAIERSEDWSEHLQQTDVTLVPAACYPLYPTLRGTALGPGGRLFDLSSYVFRHEPSANPARMQIFRMKENVRVGTPEDVNNWRQEWMQKGLTLLEALGLKVKLEVANDPFFGRGGKMLAQNQTQKKMKFEITTPLFAHKEPTAIASFNYHEDKFGSTFQIFSENSAPAHTACIGFGLERVTLALFRVHGLNPGLWPEAVLRKLASQ
jgi:seryl-tRNA synthetase